MQGKTGKSRSGVALVVVLGLVAILLIVSVAFTIHMRVERAGAANLRHAAVARQVVKGALAAAIAAIDDEVADDFAPPWYDEDNPGALTYSRDYDGNVKHYWKDTFVSYDPNPNPDAVEHIAASFFTPEVEQYFPSGAAYKGYALTHGISDPRTYIQQPEWIPFRDEDDGVMGRYAFFVMDTSGLLDASCVNRTNRWMGKFSREIPLTDKILTEEVLDGEALTANLTNDGRYDSFAEFRALNEEKDQVIRNTRTLTTFSYDPGNTNAVYIGGSATELRSRKKEIIEAFYDCGLKAGKKFGAKDSEQARWAYLGLVDYVDADDVMEDDDKINPWERPVTERMPLMGGFICKFTVERREHLKKDGEAEDAPLVKDPKNCEMRFRAEFKIPFVYPFVDTGSSTATIEGKATFAAGENISGDYLDDGLGLFPYGFADGDKKDVVSKEESIEEMEDDISVKGMSIASTDWTVVKNLENNVPRPLSNKNEPLEVFFLAAGQTKRDGKVQHRYPVSAAAYDAPFDSTTGVMDYDWMTVPFNFNEEGVEFSNEDATGEDDEGRKCWKKEIVVWAEVFDPRFASSQMASRDNKEHLWHAQRKYYRPSHMLKDYYNKDSKHYAVPITKIASFDNNKTQGYFNGFNGDAKASVAKFDSDHDFGGYFDGKDSRGPMYKCRGGSGPLASFVLTHPDAATKVYEMNIDGVRIANGESESTTDRARVKWRAFVKNGPLESVGELAYLPIGMWYTIRLYDYGNTSSVHFSNDYDAMTKYNHLPSDDSSDMPPYHPVLDYFTLHQEKVQGRVFINSLNEKALASVFYRMPIGTESDHYLCCWPVTTPDNYTSEKFRMNLDEATDLVSAIIEYRKKEDFATLSDLGKVFKYGDEDSDGRIQGAEFKMGYASRAVASSVKRGDSNMPFGEFERESVIRNSCGLFTTRGQTFIIAVRGEAYSPMFGKTSVEGGSVNAAKTAVAQIWRDSEPDENGNHPVFVQFFKIIDD